MSGIDTGLVRYVSSHDKILDVLGLIHREFRYLRVLAIVGSSNVSRLTDLEKFTVLVIPMSGMDGQRPMASFQMP